jgi:hypothetical protein
MSEIHIMKIGIACFHKDIAISSVFESEILSAGAGMGV